MTIHILRKSYYETLLKWGRNTENNTETGDPEIPTRRLRDIVLCSFTYKFTFSEFAPARLTSTQVDLGIHICVITASLAYSISHYSLG